MQKMQTAQQIIDNANVTDFKQKFYHDIWLQEQAKEKLSKIARVRK